MSIAIPLARSSSRSISRSLQRSYSKVTFNSIVKPLFANSEQGFAYDLNDLSTMFQDAAGTIPVTGAGQPVGKILDKSGNNNHAIQLTSSMRPLLQQNAITNAYYLDFDGIDDFLYIQNIDFSAKDEFSLFASVRKSAFTNISAPICELSVISTTSNGTFALFAPQGGIQNYMYRSRGTATSEASTPQNSYVAPISNVISAYSKISSKSNNIRLNGSLIISSNGIDQGSGNYGNYPLYIGRRAGSKLPFTGHIYSLTGLGRIATTTEIMNVESLLSKQIGVALSV